MFTTPKGSDLETSACAEKLTSAKFARITLGARWWLVAHPVPLLNHSVFPRQRPEGDVIRLDRVFLFGNKLSFLIPHDWVEGEEPEDDHYLYHAPETESGWLRVSLITLKTVEPPSQRLGQIYGTKENVTVDAKTGNYVRVSEKDSKEDGSSIHIYFWNVANFVLPDLIHEVVFSYTILQERINDQSTVQTVSLIGKLVREVEFSSPIANSTMNDLCC